MGPKLSLLGYTPLLQPEKRLYLIVFSFLIWILKFLLLDLEKKGTIPPSDPESLNQLKLLAERFKGAISFLKKNKLTRGQHTTQLEDLPWFLLIGPKEAGKTHLLAKSNINFVLQKQFPNQEAISFSENCDWWVTQKACILDVPSSYILSNKNKKRPFLWHALLELIKKEKGKKAIQGVLVALPLPEIMKNNDQKRYQIYLHLILNRLYDIKKCFPHPLAIYFVITKCDQLAGFSEFFNESSNEEMNQIWGIQVAPTQGKKLYETTLAGLNALIKKINQQLLWRLHQERNVFSRALIKEFPLQVERLKEWILEFVKKIENQSFSLSLQGIYLTSALQEGEKSNQPLEYNETVQPKTKGLQIFKAPNLSSKPFFINQFLSQALTIPTTVISTKEPSRFRDRLVYATSFVLIVVAAGLLGSDFFQGVTKISNLRHDFSNYRFSLQTSHNPDEYLAKTLAMINFLKTKVDLTTNKTPGAMPLDFYSKKSQVKVNETYQEALNSILLPALKNFLEEYLKNPVNKTSDNLYATLKTYLMLGDKTHLQTEYVYRIILLLPIKSLTSNEKLDFIHHLNQTFKSNWKPLPLDLQLIEDTRDYLANLPSFQLAYLILKNLNRNNDAQSLPFPSHSAIFSNKHLPNQIPNMFTVKTFKGTIEEDLLIAGNEAIMGNWVLGGGFHKQESPEDLVDQLRQTYLTNYVATWENLLNNLHLNTVNNLSELDELILNLISSKSPLLQLLQTLHDNTYFEPIISSSPKLQRLGELIEKSHQSNNLLYQIFSTLQSLHKMVQAIAESDNVKKSAFEVVSSRMKDHDKMDPLTQLRLISQNSPEPIRSWLDKIADETWRIIMTHSTQYIDLSWQNEVIHVYQKDIAKRYPFDLQANEEVELLKFTQFFGYPGVITNFFNTVLAPFVDNSSPEWHWRTRDGIKLPFSDAKLRQIQYALRIHEIFFPAHDNMLRLSFVLQPYRFSKLIKRVKFNINTTEVIDEKSKTSQHVINWPTDGNSKLTTLELTLKNQQIFKRDFPGDWGLFRLVNQSFESAVTKKEMIINIAMNEHKAKYLLFTVNQHNPFMSLNLKHFYLPQQLT